VIFVFTALTIGGMFLAMALFVYRARKSTAASDAAAAVPLEEKANPSYPSEEEHAEERSSDPGPGSGDAAASHFPPPPSSFVALRSLRSSQIQPTSSFLAEHGDDDEKSGASRSFISRSLKEPLLQ
jgi:hypothetical protein